MGETVTILLDKNIAALKTKNVFADHIEIKEALVPDKNNKPTLKDPKSLSGYRSVPISPEMNPDLDVTVYEATCQRSARTGFSRKS